MNLRQKIDVKQWSTDKKIDVAFWFFAAASVTGIFVGPSYLFCLTLSGMSLCLGLSFARKAERQRMSAFKQECGDWASQNLRPKAGDAGIVSDELVRYRHFSERVISYGSRVSIMDSQFTQRLELAPWSYGVCITRCRFYNNDSSHDGLME